MTNSIINGKHIPEDEWWVWAVHLRHFDSSRMGRGPVAEDHRSTYNHDHHYERHDNFCGKCVVPQMELFEFQSPLSDGYHTWCHGCMMKLADFFGKRTCPVCGFGFAGCGSGIHHCIFGHEWKEDGAGRKTIISPVDLPSETKEVVICGACDEWNKTDAVTCRNCGSKLIKD